MSSGDPEHDGSPDAEKPSTPEPDPLDVDSAFAAIIAGWADAPSVGSWPADEDLSVGRHRRADDDTPDDAATKDGAGRDDPAARDRSGRDAAAPNHRDELADRPLPPPDGPLIPIYRLPGEVEPEPEEAEGFVPPEPPPIPRGDLVSRLAWSGLILGPAFLLTSAMFWRSAPQLLVVAAVGGFVGGFVTLVWRMPKHRDDNDDDGAVV